MPPTTLRPLTGEQDSSAGTPYCHLCTTHRCFFTFRPCRWWNGHDKVVLGVAATWATLASTCRPRSRPFFVLHGRAVGCARAAHVPHARPGIVRRRHGLGDEARRGVQGRD